MLRYLIFWFVFNVLGRLPRPILYWIAEVVARVGYSLAPGIRANVWDNLRHLMPDAPRRRVRKAAKAVFRNVAYYYADLAQMERMDLDDFFHNRLIYYGIEEHIRSNLNEGRGVVMLSAHVGNAEIAGQALIPLGIPCFAVTEPVEPAPLRRMLNKIRSAHGVEFMPVGVSSAKRIVRILRDGGTVALMGDRDISGPRMRLPFFGEETWLPTGPIEVALRTGAAIVPSFSVRRGRYTIEAWAEEPIEVERTGDLQTDVKTATLAFIERMEAFLRREPESWGVFERIWDGDAASPQPTRKPEEVGV
ncbi:MAG TPA: lysophospholipid acyltransferase family protein [Dehalococcoidia bacterium]|nr:lysophospholipid acyltransferase family protein [Dehalococcoidia bacterium]